MNETEQLEELHLALEGAVDQLVRAQRIALIGVEPGAERAPRTERIETLLATTVALRNEVREHLMQKKATATKAVPNARMGAPILLRSDKD